MSIIAPEAPSEHNRQSILVGNAPVGKRIRAPALTPQPDVHRAAVPSLLPLSLMPSPPLPHRCQSAVTHTSCWYSWRRCFAASHTSR